MNHVDHSHSSKSAFFYYPLGAFKMDLSPNFIWFIEFSSVRIGLHGDECSPSSTL